jgi:AMMECR1 domain-containing protein
LRNIPVEYASTKKYQPIQIPGFTNEGVFVTLYERGDLAGCIGSFYGKQGSIVEKIINQTNQSMEDFRFGHGSNYFTGRKNITSTITILGPVTKHDLQTVNDFYVPAYHGVILYCDGQQRSTYLPHVMIEQKWIKNGGLNVDEVVTSLQHKAGVSLCGKIEIGLYAGYEIQSDQ